MTENAVQAVLSHYALLGGEVRIEALGCGGGWSGSRLWRVMDGTGEAYCLRRWPADHPPRDRLRMIHAVLLAAAGELPMVAFPLRTSLGQTIVQHAGNLWEMTAWRPGVADFHAKANVARLRAAMRALAIFHNQASGFDRRVGAAPAIGSRIEQLRALEGGDWLALEQATERPLRNELDVRASRVVSLLKHVWQRSSWLGPLLAVADLTLLPAIRDIHHDHVLFTDDEVTGIIDFGAMRMDTPLTDIARLVGSLVMDDQKLRQIAFDAYGELRPLREEDRRIVDLLDETGLILGAVNWLKWLYVERREMGPVEPIARRLDGMIRRLESRCAGFGNG